MAVAQPDLRRAATHAQLIAALQREVIHPRGPEGSGWGRLD